MKILGIDIGGSGIKGAIVDTVTGEMLTERFRIPTPPSRKPKEMAKVVAKIVKHFNYDGPIGCGFPAVVKNGVCKGYGNLSKKWLNTNAEELLSKATGLEVTVINDADAAGFAEIKYGAGKDKKGLVTMITIGTGLGSGVFLNGQLLPNFELGQIPYKKYKKIEHWASGYAKESKGLSYKKWGKRFNTFLQYVNVITAPDLIIIGGGASKDWADFKDCITIDTPVTPAKLLNNAGIVGAAAAAI